MNEPIAIPGYRTLRELGAGGMATVHLAIQESFDREVALKIMSPMFNVDPSFATRFVREARIISQIHHASIVPVHDVGEYRRHQYLSMEYLPGGDLKHRLQQHGPNPKLALTVCRAISSALELAHKKGFVHRDIKPENILFREDGTPVLTDFGIARAIDSGTSLTRVGTLVGTPAYMSPEQIKGLELDGRSDLYSLGIVLFEMLTGSQPFRADSTLSLALKHITEDLPPLPAGVAQFQSVLDRLTARERDNRFTSGADVLEALNRFDANGMLRVPAQAVASVRNPTPYHSPNETLTQLREVPAVGPGAQPPLIPRSTRTLWIALGTAVISGAVGMTYMSTRPASEEPAATAQSTPAKTQIADPVAAQPTASSNEPMRAANAPALTPTMATKPPPSMSGAGALPRREAREPSAPQASKPSTRASRPPPVESAQSKPATTASTRGPMPEAQEVLPPTSAPAGARSLQIPLNLIDHALWGEERWRDAAEPERIARFLVDDIRILTLQMFAEDLGNGVARFGVRGNLTNSSLEERVVTLRIDLVNGSETTISIPLEVEVDEQEEEEFDHELQMAAGNIRTSPATRVRITLSSKVPE
jgi:serine/threonine protein kinase